jgi:hypothetical protein
MPSWFPEGSNLVPAVLHTAALPGELENQARVFLPPRAAGACPACYPARPSRRDGTNRTSATWSQARRDAISLHPVTGVLPLNYEPGIEPGLPACVGLA